MASVNFKHYEWQLSDGRQWYRIDNDHVIESHYCQPGAKGITINTSNYGKIFIDFDTLQIPNNTLTVQRLSLLPEEQAEDICWYFRDDLLWCEYGSQGSSMLVSSANSKDIEHQFSIDPQGTFSFFISSTTYVLNFSTMTQTNCTTGMCRDVRRRPKFSDHSLHSPFSLPLGTTPSSSSQLTGGCCRWEFMGDNNVWTEYQAHVCSFDSSTIEQQYQLNPTGQLHFNIKRFSYTLDFSGMVQVNNQIGTRREVRRMVDGMSQTHRGEVQWQYSDDNGMWRDFSKGNSQCSVSSQDIELEYQRNPYGTMMFTTKYFRYELDFSAMTQRNVTTNTVRSVQRVSQ
ncbi:uncharacterized protein si:ch211-244b2.3 [Thalassophryne amazonica]|uniref:uncharacterized protein si:ch211-244b2.3 n=1 Tax=Thalassophryne amazonica TaxID=390379 RepID=UPI00147123D3|nr:uncharacterized protein si:ch211-244b2.3 [Thalassophryne amazonica]